MGTSSLMAPDFADEQMALWALEAFVYAALLTGGDLGSRPGFPISFFHLPSPCPSPLTCTGSLSDPAGVRGLHLREGPMVPMPTTLLAQAWTSQLPIPKAPDTRAGALLGSPPRPGLPFLLPLWGKPPFLLGQEPCRLGDTTDHQTSPKPGRPHFAATLNLAS